MAKKQVGKSYQMKHNEMVLHFLETGKRFILLRRWKEDITSLWIDRYFNEDVDIKRITNDKYNYITSYRKEIFLSKVDEFGKIIDRGIKIRVWYEFVDRATLFFSFIFRCRQYCF